MLKIYNTLDEVPEALREHYKKSDGRYVPDLSDDHPVLVHNKTLLSEKTTATNKVKELEADLAATSEKSVPRGHTAVKKEDAQLLDQYKALGTPDEVGAIKTEHATLKEKDVQRTRDDNLRKVATALGYTNVEAFVRLPNLPEFTSKPNKDGKTVDWFVQLKDDKGVVTEKPAKEFVESSPDIQPFMSALKQSEGVRVPTTGPTTQPVEGDPFKWAKDYAKVYTEQSQPVTDPFKAFNERSSAA